MGVAGVRLRTKLAALKRYGLLEESESGDVRLSDLAMEIVHHPPESKARREALHEAALRPNLFRDLQNSYPDASDDVLRAHLITKTGFSDTGAQAVIEAFRDTQQAARLGSMSEVPSPMKEPFVAPQPQSLYAPSHTADPKEPATRLYSWPLAKGVTAEVRFIGRVQPKHLDLLCKYLEVAKTAIELDSEGDEEALQ